MTIDATPAGPAADSYLTLDQADQYFQADYDFAAVWAGLSEEDRSRLLVSAARAIDRLRYKGRLYDETTPQALQFPRIIGGRVHDLTSAGELAVPKAVRQAACEQARYIYISGSDGGPADLISFGLGSFQLDRITVRASERVRPRGLAPAALRLLAPYLAHSLEIIRT